MSAQLHVAVLFGGASAERDVSIASATQIIAALRAGGHRVIPVDTATGIVPPEEESTRLHATVGLAPALESQTLGLLQRDPGTILNHPDLGRCDLWFLALHGGAGEDGTLQALLDLAGKSYTGSGVLGSALAMDKDLAKRLLRAAGVPTADWLMAPATAADIGARLGWPVVVKPSKQGSTVGLSLVRGPEDLPRALDDAYAHDNEVMIERFIAGRELTVGILGDEALAVGEILLRGRDIFDYEAKYQGGVAEIFPAEIAPQEADQARTWALQAHRALKLRDYSRADFRRDARGSWWCLEVNSLPGMTAASLLPQSAAARGISFPMLCERICRLALERQGSARGTARL